MLSRTSLRVSVSVVGSNLQVNPNSRYSAFGRWHASMSARRATERTRAVSAIYVNAGLQRESQIPLQPRQRSEEKAHELRLIDFVSCGVDSKHLQIIQWGEFTMPVLTTRDRANLYYKRWGTGRPVVLIHGWPLTADTWDEIAMALANEGYQVVSYDRRGFGRSDQPWDGYNYDRLSDDLLDVLQELRLDDVTLIGFSMGGGEIARYMSRHSGVLIQSTVLIASIVPGLMKTSENPAGVSNEQLTQMKAAIQKDRAAFFTTFFTDFYGKTLLSQPVSPEILAWSCKQAMDASIKATLDCIDAFGLTDFRNELPYFKVPTLLLHGTADRIVPIDATARSAAKLISGSTLIEYPNAPHGLLATHRDQVIKDLLGFLTASDQPLDVPETMTVA